MNRTHVSFGLLEKTQSGDNERLRNNHDEDGRVAKENL